MGHIWNTLVCIRVPPGHWVPRVGLSIVVDPDLLSDRQLSSKKPFPDVRSTERFQAQLFLRCFHECLQLELLWLQGHLDNVDKTFVELVKAAAKGCHRLQLEPFLQLKVTLVPLQKTSFADEAPLRIVQAHGELIIKMCQDLQGG